MVAISTTVVRLELVTISSGATEASKTLATGASALPRSVGTDGILVYPIYRTVTGSEKNATCIPDGNTFIQHNEQTTSLTITDVAFDGQFWWLMSGTTIYQATNPTASGTILKSWNHGLSNIRGLTLVGDNIGLMTI